MSHDSSYNPYEQPEVKSQASGDEILDEESEAIENFKFTSHLIYCAAAFCMLCVAYYLWQASIGFRLLELTRSFGMLGVYAIINIVFALGFVTAAFLLWKYGATLSRFSNKAVSQLDLSQRQAYSWLSILLVAILFIAKYAFEELKVSGLI